MVEAIWNYKEGIRIARFKAINVYGNYSKSPKCLDFNLNKDLRITPYEHKQYYIYYLTLRDSKGNIKGYQFIDFLIELIEEFFGGANGDYEVLGKYVIDGAKRHLFNYPVIYFNYSSNGITIEKMRSYSKKYGKTKSTSKTYGIFKLAPEVRDFVV